MLEMINNRIPLGADVPMPVIEGAVKTVRGGPSGGPESSKLEDITARFTPLKEVGPARHLDELKVPARQGPTGVHAVRRSAEILAGYAPEPPDGSLRDKGRGGLDSSGHGRSEIEQCLHSEAAMMMFIGQLCIDTLAARSVTDSKALKQMSHLQSQNIDEQAKQNQAIAKKQQQANENQHKGGFFALLMDILSFVVDAVEGVCEAVVMDPQGLATLASAGLDAAQLGLQIASMTTKNPARLAKIQKDMADVGYAQIAVAVVGCAAGAALAKMAAKAGAEVGEKAAATTSEVLSKAESDSGVVASTEADLDELGEITPETEVTESPEGTAEPGESAEGVEGGEGADGSAEVDAETPSEESAAQDKKVAETREQITEELTDDAVQSATKDAEKAKEIRTALAKGIADDVVGSMGKRLEFLQKTMMKGAFSEEFLKDLVQSVVEKALEENGTTLSEDALKDIENNVKDSIGEGVSASRSRAVILLRTSKIAAQAINGIGQGIIGKTGARLNLEVSQLQLQQQSMSYSATMLNQWRQTVVQNLKKEASDTAAMQSMLTTVVKQRIAGFDAIANHI